MNIVIVFAKLFAASFFASIYFRCCSKHPDSICVDHVSIYFSYCAKDLGVLHFNNLLFEWFVVYKNASKKEITTRDQHDQHIKHNKHTKHTKVTSFVTQTQNICCFADSA